MIKKTIYLCLAIAAFFCMAWATRREKAIRFFAANDSKIQYTGRIDFSNPLLPRFWSPGVYVKIRFKGNNCVLNLNDEQATVKQHNYVSIIIDNNPVKKIKLADKTNVINLGAGLGPGEHNLLIVKSTESGIGYLEFAGISCDKLLAPAMRPPHRIEFIGNSITCGTGSDVSEFPCKTGEWYDQHNAYMSYGPLTARSLNAEWQLTAVSGIGLIKSCCNMDIVMPQVFDKIDLRQNAIQWDFKHYQPDVVTVCLGQNDGIQDSTIFCSAYINFIKRLRRYYPATEVICLTSPMADEKLVAVQKSYLKGIVNNAHQYGDQKVSKFYFSKRFNNGCGDHPDLAQHVEIAAELSAFIKKLKNW